MPGFVGYYGDHNIEILPAVDEAQRSRIVVAPPLAKSNLLSFADTDRNVRVTCATEMNGIVPLDFITQHTRPGDYIADFMCGSGSAALAAAISCRSSISIDLAEPMVIYFHAIE